MKKTVGIIAATALCAGCLALAACGGSSQPASEPAPAETSAAATEAAAPAEPAAQEAEPAAAEPAAAEPAAPVDPTEAFVGEWKLAAADYDGLMISGDMSQIEWTSGSKLAVNADGTGTVGMFGEEITFAWTLSGDGTALDISPVSADAEGGSNLAAAQIVLVSPGVLGFTMESEGQSATLYFSADGTYADAPVISAEGAKDITSPEQLIGTWTLAGMNYGGATVTGEAGALAEMANYDNANLVINEDGSATVFGSESTWEIADGGAVIADGSSTMPMKSLDDKLIIDLSAYAGMNMVMLLTK